MGKGARLKKERKEQELRKIQEKETTLKMIHQNIEKFKTIKSEFILRWHLDRIPEAILTKMADIIISRHWEEFCEYVQERRGKGERNDKWERHGHLLSVEGFTNEQFIGWMRRHAFYNSLIKGSVALEKHEETYEKPGHLLAPVLASEWLHWGRWEYWMKVMQGSIEKSGPIPQIMWCTDPLILRTIQASIRDCVNYGIRYGCTLDDFADWILWGFGGTASKHPDIPSEVNIYWLKTFDYDSMIRYPSDYMTSLLIEWYSRDVEEERNVSLEMVDFKVYSQKVEDDLSGKNPEKLKKIEIFEEEVGCGAALLPYSNFTFFAGGGVADPLAMKLNKINMTLYAPWYAHNPFRDKSLERWKPMDIKELVAQLFINDGSIDDQPRLIMLDESNGKPQFITIEDKRLIEGMLL